MGNYLSQSDIDNYGSDLVDFSQRAAIDALAPHLRALEQQSAHLQQQVVKTARQALDQAVAAAVPNYKEIDRDPEWHQWLLTVDPLSGRMRQVLLNDAIQASDAARVISFFHKFQREVGHAESVNSSTGRLPPSQRRAAAPQGVIYSRQQIAALFRAHQNGAYRGRESEWARQEADIIRASGEGRIAGGVDVHGK